jgi:Uma2 family endonuclease
MSIAEKYRPQFTYEDYCQWEGRWELIEGMPYAMSPAPSRNHQLISRKLVLLFEHAIQGNCDGCSVYYAPLDWIVNANTVVQPDIMVICGDFTTVSLEFPPTIVVEILSKSTAFKDRHEKYELYEQEGVQYYIIVDPQFKKIEIYQLIDMKFQSMAVTPEQFNFSLPNACALPVSFHGIWE